MRRSQIANFLACVSLNKVATLYSGPATIRKPLRRYASDLGSFQKVGLHIIFRSIFPPSEDMSFLICFDAYEHFLSSATSYDMASLRKLTSRRYEKPLGVSTAVEGSSRGKKVAKDCPHLGSTRSLTTSGRYGCSELQTVSVLPLRNLNI